MHDPMPNDLHGRDHWKEPELQGHHQPSHGCSADPMRCWHGPIDSQRCCRCGEASAERIDFKWSNHLNRAQGFPDGLPNKDSTGQHCSETTQTEDEARGNATGVSEFSLVLLSAGSHLS